MNSEMKTLQERLHECNVTPQGISFNHPNSNNNRGPVSSRRDFVKMAAWGTLGAAAAVDAATSQIPKAVAAGIVGVAKQLAAATQAPLPIAKQSSEAIGPSPALVFSEIDGQFSDINKLRLTPLGEKLVAEDKRWMPTNEWVDALSKPQTWYNPGSLTTDNAVIRMKIYEKGWIDSNRWLDILVDHPANPSITRHPGFATDPLYLFINPTNEYSDDTTGYYLFNISNMTLTKPERIQSHFEYWKGPFKKYNWKPVPSDMGKGTCGEGTSPDFPAVGNHVIYEERINLDKIGVGDSFGFAGRVWKFVVEKQGEVKEYIERDWPKEFAQYGCLKVPGSDLYYLPSYYGDVKPSGVPVPELSLRDVAIATAVLATGVGLTVYQKKKES